MLEVKFDKATKEIRAWCGDSKQFGNLKPNEGEDVTMLDIDASTIPDARNYRLEKGAIKAEGIAPPPRNIFNELDAMKEWLLLLESKKIGE